MKSVCCAPETTITLYVNYTLNNNNNNSIICAPPPKSQLRHMYEYIGKNMCSHGGEFTFLVFIHLECCMYQALF